MNTPVKQDRAVNLSVPGEVDAPVPVAPKEAAVKLLKPKERVREAQDYRTMRAADVDASTLTAAVLTLDGYVCPVPVEKK